MRVAIVRPPEVNPYWQVARPLLGIGYISSYLESNGIECKIFDANFNAWTEEQTVEAVVKYNPDLIGFSAMTHEICAAHSLASKLNSSLSGVPTVIGGCHITALPQETLEEFSGFTYGIYGEGEKTLLQLARYLQQGKSGSLSDINGLVCRSDSAGIQINPPRDRLSSEELDKLPYPMFSQYYKTEKPLAGKDDYYVMMSSRGCPYNCVFCMQVLGRQVRRRSARSVVDEMEYAIERYGAHSVYFFDEIFLFNDKLTYETIELMKKRGLPKRIRWQGLTRVNFVDENLIKQAKEAGCFALQLGIESGNDEILKVINKHITVKDAEAAVKIIKKAGVSVEANFILGHPGETPETVKQTIDFAARLNTDLVSIGIMTPYPGTKVYEMAKHGEGGYRLLTKDWSKYDKYGGRALELKGLPIKELEKWQRRGLLNFYLKNFRILDLTKFVLRYRRTIFNLLLKHLGLS
jgi:anaerobic magnesium-protoporphyrin IX monomethyl ester cyclase